MAMKFAPTLILILSIGVPLAHAQTPTLISKEAPTFRKPGMVKGAPAKPLLQHLPRLLARPALAISSASVTYVTCPEITASLCGYVPVPLDRKYPNGPQLQIYFEVYPNMGGGTAESAIMENLGGPGPGTTQSPDYFQFLFAPNMDVKDLL